MIQILAGNSYSKITGLSVAQFKALQQVLSYVIGGSSSFFAGYGPKRRSLLSKKGEFPTGLHYRVHKHLIDNRIRFDMIYAPGVPGRSSMKSYPTAYSWQREALGMAYIENRGAIRAPTGTGKSRAMGMFAESFNVKTLWVVPSLEIKTQTIASWGHLKNVAITNIDDPKLEKMSDFDMLLMDECHRAAARRYHKLNKTAWTRIYYRYSFSATTFRNDPEETLLYEAIAGQEIYSLSYAKAVANDYIVPIESYFIDVPKQATDAHTYRQVYNELIVNNTSRNVAIAKLLTALHSAGMSTLCMVREVAHGKILSEITGLPFVNGTDEDSRKYIKRFNEGVLKVLIGTEGIIGEGVDTKPCEYVIVAGSGKAKSNFMQKCGRAVRNYPGKESAKIILIRDRSHKFLSRHYNAQKSILREEYNSIPGKLDV